MKKYPNRILIFIALASLASVMVSAAPKPVTAFDAAAEEALTETAEISSVVLEGEGTQQQPYLVSSSDEYFALCERVNAGENTAFCKLTEDIDFGGKTLVPIGTNEHPFKGNFDGNGKTLNNFVLSGEEYIGVFGNIDSAAIKNLYIGSFNVDLTKSTAEKVYVGTVAYAINSEITNICVNNEALNNLEGKTKYVYIGLVCGYAESDSKGKMLIEDCYNICDVSFVNDSGYAYIGGIAGRFGTNSGGDSLVNRCYSVGSLSGTSINSANVGGLVGYLYSHGSAYSPGVGSLSADDVDVMLQNSFAAASVYAKSNYTSNVGKIVAYANQYAGCQTSTVLYTNDSSISVTGEHRTVGTKVDITSLQSEEYLKEKLGFDFTNTWTILADSTYKYPAFLKSEKAFEKNEEIPFRPVSSDVTMNSNGNVLTIENVRFSCGHKLTLDRGTYIINSVEGTPVIEADPNTNIIIKCENKPQNYVELDIGDKKQSTNVRYAEVNGKQYEIKADGEKYGLIVKEPTLVEIVEKTSGGTAVGTSKYYIADSDGTMTELGSLNNVITSTDKYSIRLGDKTGIRFEATADALKKAAEQDYKIVEYGYILTLKKHLDANPGSQLNFDFEKKVSGVAYNVNDGTDIVFSSDDYTQTFTAVLHDIPKDGYNEDVVAKTYTKVLVDDKEYIFYGEEMTTSLYKAASSLDKDGLNDEQKEILDGILKA